MLIIKYNKILSEYTNPPYYRKDAEIWWSFFEFVRSNYDINILVIWRLGNGAVFEMGCPTLEHIKNRNDDLQHYFDKLVGIGIFSHSYFDYSPFKLQSPTLDLEFLGFVVNEFIEQEQSPLEALINDDYILIRWRPCENFTG